MTLEGSNDFNADASFKPLAFLVWLWVIVSQVERVGCRLLLIALTQMEVPSTLFDTRLVVTSAGLILTCLLLAGMIIFLTAKGGRRVSVGMMVLSFSALLIFALSYLAGNKSKKFDTPRRIFFFFF